MTCESIQAQIYEHVTDYGPYFVFILERNSAITKAQIETDIANYSGHSIVMDTEPAQIAISDAIYQVAFALQYQSDPDCSQERMNAEQANYLACQICSLFTMPPTLACCSGRLTNNNNRGIALVDGQYMFVLWFAD